MSLAPKAPAAPCAVPRHGPAGVVASSSCSMRRTPRRSTSRSSPDCRRRRSKRVTSCSARRWRCSTSTTPSPTFAARCSQLARSRAAAHLDIPEPEPQQLVLYRAGDLRLYHRPVGPEAFALLDGLRRGLSLVAACEHALEQAPAHADRLQRNVGAWFQQWANRGWIVDAIPNPTPTRDRPQACAPSLRRPARPADTPRGNPRHWNPVTLPVGRTLAREKRVARVHSLLERVARQRTTLLMGIVNVTPNSFYDGGRYEAPEAGRQRVVQLLAEGADILDIGGESSKPGAPRVAAEQQLERIDAALGEALARDAVVRSTPRARRSPTPRSNAARTSSTT